MIILDFKSGDMSIYVYKQMDPLMQNLQTPQDTIKIINKRK
jgi:hypothetical protein